MKKIYGLLGLYIILNLAMLTYFERLMVIASAGETDIQQYESSETRPNNAAIDLIWSDSAPVEAKETSARLETIDQEATIEDSSSPDAPCLILQKATTQLFNVKVVKTETAFEDTDLSLSGIDCRLTALRESTNPEDFLTIAAALKQRLESQDSWREDPTYIAYGPTETTLAFTKNNQSGILNVGWQPYQALTCVTGQPAAACQTNSNRRLYTITFSYSIAPRENNEPSL